MKLLGVDLIKPTFSRITAECFIGVMVWAMWVGVRMLFDLPPTYEEAVSLLLICFIGALFAAFGVVITRGWPHVRLILLIGVPVYLVLFNLARLGLAAAGYGNAA